jgi:group I intron endonuclease
MMKTTEDKIVYFFINKTNGKIYIGQTTNFEQRVKNHIQQGNKHNPKSIFHKALKKYDILKDFIHIKIVCSGSENSHELEKYYIKEFNTIHPNGYNMTSGGTGGDTFSFRNREEQEKTKNLMKGRIPWNKGKSLSKEIREKLKQSHMGKKLPQSQKNKIGVGVSKYYKDHPEKLKKIGENRRGEKNPFARSVVLISPENKEYRIKGYTSFCKEHNLGVGYIYQVLRGKRKEYKGWTGRYI